MKNLPYIKILDVPIHNVNYVEALKTVDEMIKTNKPHQITTVNPEFLVIANKNNKFKKVLQNADLSLADGIGLQFAALLQGKSFKTRVAGSRLVYKLLPLLEKEDYKVFLLGAAPGVAKKATKNILNEYPNLKINYSSADPNKQGTETAINEIKKFKPHILLVAYGAPTQDLWISENKKKLNVPVMIGVGGTIDYIAGVSSMPPDLFHKLGLEWLYRLIKEPRRWKRQLRLPLFVLLILFERIEQAFS